MISSAMHLGMCRARGSSFAPSASGAFTRHTCKPMGRTARPYEHQPHARLMRYRDVQAVRAWHYAGLNGQPHQRQTDAKDGIWHLGEVR